MTNIARAGIPGITHQPREKLSCYLDISPKVAAAWRRDFPFPRQRNIQPSRVQFLRIEIQAGDFNPVAFIAFAVLPNDDAFLVNGNHTLEALKQLNRDVELSIAVFPCKDMVEVNKLYNSFDAYKPRTWGDAFRAEGMTDEIPNVKAIAPAVLIINARFTDPRALVLPRQKRIESVREYKHQAFLWHELVARKDARLINLLQRRAHLCVILETLRQQEALAMKFWGETLADDGLKQGHPGKTLLAYASRVKAQSGTLRLHIDWTARAWNAAYAGIEMRVPREMKHFHLRGTSWKMPKHLRDEDENDRPTKHAGGELPATAP